MIFAGIDPGLDGAIAVISPRKIEIIDIPTLLVGKRREVDAHALVKILRGLRGGQGGASWSFPAKDLIVGLERVHSMPKQGVASSFSFGKTAGVLQGVCSGLQLPFQMVTPQAWHKTMLAGMPKGKDSSIQKCHELFPEVDCITKKSHHNRADALLIAEHIRRTTGGSGE